MLDSAQVDSTIHNFLDFLGFWASNNTFKKYLEHEKPTQKQISARNTRNKNNQFMWDMAPQAPSRAKNYVSSFLSSKPCGAWAGKNFGVEVAPCLRHGPTSTPKFFPVRRRKGLKIMFLAQENTKFRNFTIFTICFQAKIWNTILSEI